MRAILNLKRVLVLAAVFVQLPLRAEAKELYMTVLRDFSPSEAPQVEVSYARELPITFRLLKPKDLKAFIASQIDLRRAWKEPRSEINTANPLLRGLDGFQINFDWIRSAVDESLRKSLIKTYGGGSKRNSGSAMPRGPRKLVAVPDQFEVVTEFSIETRQADPKQPFDVPGFEEFNGSSLQSRLVSLPVLKTGFYVLQTIQGDNEGQVLIVVNNILASLQQSDGQASVRVADRQGHPLRDATVSVRDLNGKWIATKKTDGKGAVSFTGIDAKELVVLVESDGAAIIDTAFFPSVAVSEDVYLYSDRPMYKPGDQVQFRGILRKPTNGLSSLISERNVTVQLVSAEGMPSGPPRTLWVNEFGAFSGEITSSENANGLFRLTANVGTKDHIGEVRIKEYIKPVFFAKVTSLQETLGAGQTLTARVKAERYAGGAPRKAQYKVDLYRSRLESPKWIDDAGKGESGSKVTYGFDPSSVVDVSIPELLTSIDEKSLPASGEAEFSLVIPEADADTRYDYKYSVKVTVRDGDGNVSVGAKTFLDMNSEILAQVRFNASFTSGEFPARLLVRSVLPSGKPYGVTKGRLVWLRESYQGTEEKISEQDFLTDANGAFEISAPTDKPGRLSARIDLFDRSGAKASSDTSIVVLPAKIGEPAVSVDELQLYVRKTQYAPGETAKVLLLLPSGWGEKGSNKGTVYLTVAGGRIHETRSIDVQGLTAFIEQPVKADYGTAVYFLVSYANPQRGWVERTLSLVIPPLDKLLNVTVKPENENVFPGSEQTVSFLVLDHKGSPIQSELSVSVVDRKVLDLQPEFRPSLLEFFYPIERLNVMTFISSQFQSYGYGEKIARLFRANRDFAAAKSPADRPVEKDTAFWTASIKTDAKGEAKATFPLPPNQTIWTVTAVAVDQDGHFGEASAEFKANSPVQAILAMPSFLRHGDETTIRLTVANTDAAKSHMLTYSLTAPSAVTVTPIPSLSQTMKPGEEIRERSKLTIDPNAKDLRYILRESIQVDDKKLAFERTVRALPGWTAVQQTQMLSPSAEFQVESNDRVSRVSVTVSSGLAGAIAPGLHWLIHYPYGCVEQTASATVANLLITKMFEPGFKAIRPRVGSTSNSPSVFRQIGIWFSEIIYSILPPTLERKFTVKYQKMVTDARAFGDAGLARLKGFQNSSGEYTWFPESENVDSAMTSYVLMSVLALDEPDWARAIDAKKAYERLESSAWQNVESGGARTAIRKYLAGRLGAMKLMEFSAAGQEPDLKRLAKKLQKPLDQSFLLFALKDFGISLEGEWVDLRDRLLANVERSLTTALSNPANANLGFDTGEWDNYVGRTSSSIAITAHALHLYGRMTPELQTQVEHRLMEQFNGENFGSTFETAQTLAHSQWLLQKSANRYDRPQNLKLIVGTKTLSSEDYEVVSNIGGWTLSLKPSLFKNGANRVQLENRNEFLGASINFEQEVPLARAADFANGWTLKKTISRVNTSLNRLEPVDGKDLQVGDVAYVELAYEKQNQTDHPSGSLYYVMRDDIPAGTSLIQEDKDLIAALNLSPSQDGLRIKPLRKARLDQINWFFEGQRGRQQVKGSIGYFLRVDFAGAYRTGVARVEDFYDEQSFAQTGSSQLSVAPAGGIAK